MTRQRWSVYENQSLQHPAWPRTVYLSEMVGGWWPDLTRFCQRDQCGGRLFVIFPTLLPGRVECGWCSYEVAEVRKRRYVPPPVVFEPVKRGRPTGSKVIHEAGRRPCADCGFRVAKIKSPRCYKCGHERGRAGR